MRTLHISTETTAEKTKFVSDEQLAALEHKFEIFDFGKLGEARRKTDAVSNKPWPFSRGTHQGQMYDV